ncbi:MAG: alpha/beta hydrolase [Nitrospiraceae bacterium]|nr:alpha/beta hydrolase [Nitrospiraceae bacterium]
MKAGIIVMITFGLVLLVTTSCIHTRPFTDADGRIIPGSIATMETAMIGGIRQSIWFRGVNTANPVMILLHGGPGATESPLFRHYNAELERHFLVVYWEQRGTGRSYQRGIPPESMTIAQLVRDLDEVVERVRVRFGKDKVVLLAHSWGTVLGTIYAGQHPEKIALYAGIGQVVDMPEGERLSYEFAVSQAAARSNQSALDELRTIGPPPHSVDAMLISSKWVERFGGSFYDDLSTGKLIWVALNTDEANLLDLIKFGQGNRFSLNQLWDEFSQLRLGDRYRSFEVPIFFLLGRYDWVTPAVLADQYFSTVTAPHKRLVWFEQSAHNPPFEEADKFNQVLIEEILPQIKKQSSADEPAYQKNG